MEHKDILNLPMGENDPEAKTIGDYLRLLLIAVWEQGEVFSGKRPFGNSGWEGELYEPLIRAKVVDGQIDSDGYIDTVDQDEADEIITDLIDWVFSSAAK